YDCICLSLTRHPLSFSLFPYTTLFRSAATALRFKGAVLRTSAASKLSAARAAIPLPAMSAAAVNNREVADTSQVRWSASAVVVRASTSRTNQGTTINAANPATTAGHQAPGAI